MSEPTTPATAGQAQLVTLAVRITKEFRARLEVLSQLTGRTATDEIKLALEHWIDKTTSDPEIRAKAQAVRAEIERDAETRRNAIAAMFSGEGATGTDEAEALTSTRPAPRRGKAASE